MAPEIADRPWLELKRYAETGDAEGLAPFIQTLSPEDVARAMFRLDPEERGKVLTLLSPEEAAALLEPLSAVLGADLIEDLKPVEAAAILVELKSDERADLVGEMEPEEAQVILAELSEAEAGALQTLASYPPDVAGGLMVTEFLAYPQTTRASEVVEDLRRHAESYGDYEVQYGYVTSKEGQLVGVLRMRDLLLSRSDVAISALMIEDPMVVPLDCPLDELRGTFDRHRFIGLPVVDPAGKLVGVVRRAAVEEGLAERSESDYRKALGIVGGEELRTLPLLSRSGRRLSWLSVNIFLNIIAASVIAFYQDTLAAVIALAAFLPIISDMSGCSGNQAVAVSIRELSLGLVKPSDVVRVWGKEIAVGLLNGVVLGLMLGVAAFFWQQNIYLAMVVGGALALNTVVAVSIGGCIPLILRRLNRDPALASGPILTTVTDLCGFLLTLSLAAAAISELQA